MELEKSPAFNPESNDGYRQWSSMNGKSLLKDYWRTLKSWHDFSSLESFQTGHLVITCLTQKAYTESHVKCSRMKLVVANASGAHIPALCPPLSSAAVWGMVPVHCVQAPASTETFNQGEREASGELERCFYLPRGPRWAELCCLQLSPWQHNLKWSRSSWPTLTTPLSCLLESLSK